MMAPAAATWQVLEPLPAAGSHTHLLLCLALLRLIVTTIITTTTTIITIMATPSKVVLLHNFLQQVIIKVTQQLFWATVQLLQLLQRPAATHCTTKMTSLTMPALPMPVLLLLWGPQLSAAGGRQSLAE
jgi:hypothetical protein